MELKNKNVLVTGGSGFVGSHLIEELINKKVKVINIDISNNKLSYYFKKNLDRRSKFIRANICDYKKIEQIIKDHHISLIFHLAAEALVEKSYKNPAKTFKTNVIGTVNILEIARLNPNIKGIIIASSDKAYGKLNNKKYFESDPLSGDHPYEVSKSAADLIAQSYYKTYRLPIVITRFGNIYGEGDYNFSRIIPGIMKALVKNERLDIRSDGKYIRDYLYIKDVINGYILLARNIEKIKGQAFNFGSNETLSVLELIRLVEKTLKKKMDYKILNIAKNEIPYQSLDYSKIKKNFGLGTAL